MLIAAKIMNLYLIRREGSCFDFCIHPKRQSEHSGFRPDTSSLVNFWCGNLNFFQHSKKVWNFCDFEVLFSPDISQIFYRILTIDNLMLSWAQMKKKMVWPLIIFVKLWILKLANLGQLTLNIICVINVYAEIQITLEVAANGIEACYFAF